MIQDPESTTSSQESGDTTDDAKNVDIRMKYFMAVQEAKMWKERYLSCADEKQKQLRNIESSLMVLEARLEAERKEIERRFGKQNRAIKEQKRKIAKLTTANQKLLTGLMALSEQAGLTAAPPPYSTHQPPKYGGTPLDDVSGNPLKQNAPVKRKQQKSPTDPQAAISKEARPSTKTGPIEGHKHYKALTKTQRSKSLPLNRHTSRLTKSTEC